MLTLIVSIIIFGLLIGVHEAGHLVAAKLNKVTVHEFAIGMGPKLFSFEKGVTKYSLRLIPIGGYCKMEGEDEESSDKGAFCNKSPLRRLTILAAGAFMNLVLGFIALLIFFAPAQQIAVPEVMSIEAGMPAAESGLMAGDRIVKMNNTRINIQNDVSFFMSRNGEKPVDVTVKRGGEKLTFNITPVKSEDRWVLGFRYKVKDNNFLETLKMAFYGEFFLGKIIFISFGDLLTGGLTLADASGPVGIVNEIGRAAKTGFSDVIYLLALITINLGLVNLLPFPALDGGRIVFVLFELIFRKPVPQKWEAVVHGIGMILLLTLMIFITFQDFFKLGSLPR